MFDNAIHSVILATGLKTRPENSVMGLQDDTLSIRLNSFDKTDFMVVCRQYKVEPADMLREMIVALNDRRLTIKISKSQLLTIKGVHHAD